MIRGAEYQPLRRRSSWKSLERIHDRMLEVAQRAERERRSTARVAESLAIARAAVATMSAPTLPLEGLQILDLSRVLAGPYATQLLGDLGAEVWKVERPQVGDETRAWGPPFVGEFSAYFLSVNRNKRSVALDFRDPHDRAALKRAALAADVVVENFLPGALAPFGLDAAALRRDRPELVVCSITGFGQDGPMRRCPATTRCSRASPGSRA